MSNQMGYEIKKLRNQDRNRNNERFNSGICSTLGEEKSQIYSDFSS